MVIYAGQLATRGYRHAINSISCSVDTDKQPAGYPVVWIQDCNQQDIQHYGYRHAANRISSIIDKDMQRRGYQALWIQACSQQEYGGVDTGMPDILWCGYRHSANRISSFADTSLQPAAYQTEWIPTRNQDFKQYGYNNQQRTGDLAVCLKAYNIQQWGYCTSMQPTRYPAAWIQVAVNRISSTVSKRRAMNRISSIGGYRHSTNSISSNVKTSQQPDRISSSMDTGMQLQDIQQFGNRLATNKISGSVDTGI